MTYARPLPTVHQVFTPGFILRYRVASSELLRALLRPILSDRADCQGLSPLHDITRASPRSRRLPEPALRSVRRRSQPHDGLLLTRAPRFVSPSSRVQGRFAVQGLLPPRSAPPSSGSAAPMPLPSERFSGSRDPPPTLVRPGFEALIHAEMRSHRLGVEPGRWPLPSSGSISSRFTAPTDGAAASPLPTARGISTYGLRLRARRSSTPPASRLRRAGLRCHQQSRPAREFRA